MFIRATTWPPIFIPNANTRKLLAIESGPRVEQVDDNSSDASPPLADNDVSDVDIWSEDPKAGKMEEAQGVSIVIDMARV